MSTGSIVSDRGSDQKLVKRPRPTAREVRRALVERSLRKVKDFAEFGFLDLDQWLSVMQPADDPPEIRLCTVRLLSTDLSVTMAVPASRRKLSSSERWRAYQLLARALVTQGAA
jgi:hypothetical protein